MIDVINQKNEDRNYFTYVVTNILNEKPLSYLEWTKKLNVSNISKNNVIVDKEKVRKDAKQRLKDIFV